MEAVLGRVVLGAVADGGDDVAKGAGRRRVDLDLVLLQADAEARLAGLAVADALPATAVAHVVLARLVVERQQPQLEHSGALGLGNNELLCREHSLF